MESDPFLGQIVELKGKSIGDKTRGPPLFNQRIHPAFESGRFVPALLAGEVMGKSRADRPGRYMAVPQVANI